MDQQNKCLKELKLLVVNPEWERMDAYLSLLIKGQQSVLLSAADIETVKEAQGRIKAYSVVRSLPSTIKAMRQN